MDYVGGFGRNREAFGLDKKVMLVGDRDVSKVTAKTEQG
jgi:hypothetical protein